VLSDFKRQFSQDWGPYVGKKYTDKCDTKVPMAELKRLSKSLTTTPEGFTLHPRVRRSSTTARRWAKASCPSTGAWARTSPTPAWWCRASASAVR
jgi:2-oxoglutarate dehydrogenase E1 component